MKAVLISACLLGQSCKYSGGDNLSQALVDRCLTLEEGGLLRVVPVCPEVLGGLPVPRKPAEISAGKVRDKDGKDVTDQFVKGAEETLRIARESGCQAAILKARSPSCGAGEIYDGSFTGVLLSGNGVTAQLLIQNGISVYNEKNYEDLLNL